MCYERIFCVDADVCVYLYLYGGALATIAGFFVVWLANVSAMCYFYACFLVDST